MAKNVLELCLVCVSFATRGGDNWHHQVEGNSQDASDASFGSGTRNKHGVGTILFCGRFVPTVDLTQQDVDRKSHVSDIPLQLPTSANVASNNSVLVTFSQAEGDLMRNVRSLHPIPSQSGVNPWQSQYPSTYLSRFWKWSPGPDIDIAPCGVAVPTRVSANVARVGCGMENAKRRAAMMSPAVGTCQA